MTAHPGQLILLIAMALFVLYVFRVRTILTDRVIYLVSGLIGIILVVDPELSTWIAHKLGIGRGVDLLFYLFMIAALFYSVSVRSEMKKTQRQITQVIRQMAIAHPIEGKLLDENPNKPENEHPAGPTALGGQAG